MLIVQILSIALRRKTYIANNDSIINILLTTFTYINGQGWKENSKINQREDSIVCSSGTHYNRIGTFFNNVLLLLSVVIITSS